MTDYVLSSNVTSTLILHSGDSLMVSSGGVSSDSVIGSGAGEYVYSSGLSISDAVSSGGGMVVTSGGEVRALAISAGGTLNAEGGLISGAVVLSGGSLLDERGVTVVDTIVSRGGSASFVGSGVSAGLPAVLDISAGVTLGLTAAGVESAATFDGVTLDAGAQLTAAFDVDSGGVLSLASSYVLGGPLTVESGGIVKGSGSFIEGWEESRYGLAAFVMRDYGLVSGLQLPSGPMYVLNGGSATDVTVLESDYFAAQIGSLIVRAGGKVTDTVVLDQDALFEVDVGGSSVSAVVNGSMTVEGRASDTVISHGGRAAISGGAAFSNTILGGGHEEVYDEGRAISTTVSSGGLLEVFQGGTASALVVSGGGRVDAESGSLVESVGLQSGGTVVVSASALARAFDVQGVLYLDSGARALRISLTGGVEAVSSGAATSLDTVGEGGILELYAGATATSETMQSGGSVVVASGATANGIDTVVGAVLIDNGSAVYSASNALRGTLSGSGALVDKGGILEIFGTASAFEGLAIISGGKLDLATGGLGSAEVKFDATGSTLELLRAAQPSNGGPLAETLFNFDKPTEDLDLREQAFVSGATATLSGHELTLVDGGYTATFILNGSTVSSYASAYTVSSDGEGGTMITAAAAATPAVLTHFMAAFGARSGAGAVTASSGGGLAGIAEALFAHSAGARPD